MRDTDYAYASGFMRMLENKMLGVSDFETLLHAYSLEEALRHLSYRGYGQMRSAAPDSDVFDLVKHEQVYIWNEMKTACPADAPIDILLYQNDFHNLKTILKAFLSGASYVPLMLEPYTILPEGVNVAIVREQFEDLPDLLREPAQEAYEILRRKDDGQLAEITLDTALFMHIRKTAAQTKNRFLMGWADLRIAVMDMKVALRGARTGKDAVFLRQAMLECERISADDLAEAAGEGSSAVQEVFRSQGFAKAADAAAVSYAAFEKCLDNEIIGYIKPARRVTFGFEPVFGYLAGKEYEAQSLRIILSGLHRGIPPDSLRERLRDSYV
jgi:V/A-type H+-transporting ATPase subunit C